MLIDSHCHLDRLDLQPYQDNFSCFMQETQRKQLEHMLCVGINLETYSDMYQLVDAYPSISVSVGVHPNETAGHEPSVAELVLQAEAAKVVAIGETGLDYFRSEGELEWQKQRFRTHIRAAKEAGKPLIIHSRQAKEDTLAILAEEEAGTVGGVLHCFAEDWDMAYRALDLNFYVSFSGIVTFKNAHSVHEVAKKIPDDRFLIETDSPWLAPVPFRGKPNYPCYVQHVAEGVAALRGVSLSKVADITTRNFYNLFNPE